MSTEKIKLGDYIVNAVDLANAVWTCDESISPTTWEVDECDGSISVQHTSDEVQWRTAETNIFVINEDGKPCEITVEFAVQEGEPVTLSVNGDTSARAYTLDDNGDEDREICDYQLALNFNVPIDDHFAVNADEAAKEFIADHAGYRYVLDRKRGFSNEWTLYACANDTDVDKIMSRDGNCSELSADKVLCWIVEAILPCKEHERRYGAQKYCGLYFANSCTGE